MNVENPLQTLRELYAAICEIRVPAVLALPSRLDGMDTGRYPEWWRSLRKTRGRKDRSLRARSRRRKAARLAGILLFVLGLIAPRLSAQEPKIDWALLAADSGMRGLDVYSTHRMLALGDHEKFLPDAIAHHMPAMAAYSGAAVAADWFVLRTLERHRHPRLGRVLVSLDAGQDGFWAVHNLFLGRVKGGAR